MSRAINEIFRNNLQICQICTWNTTTNTWKTNVHSRRKYKGKNVTENLSTDTRNTYSNFSKRNNWYFRQRRAINSKKNRIWQVNGSHNCIQLTLANFEETYKGSLKKSQQITSLMWKQWKQFLKYAISQNGIKFLHFNAHSIQNRYRDISNLLQQLDSETIVIVTETWMSEEQSLNINLSVEHNFMHKNRSH